MYGHRTDAGEGRESYDEPGKGSVGGEAGAPGRDQTCENTGGLPCQRFSIAISDETHAYNFNGIDDANILKLMTRSAPALGGKHRSPVNSSDSLHMLMQNEARGQPARDGLTPLPAVIPLHPRGGEGSFLVPEEKAAVNDSPTPLTRRWEPVPLLTSSP